MANFKENYGEDAAKMTDEQFKVAVINMLHTGKEKTQSLTQEVLERLDKLDIITDTMSQNNKDIAALKLITECIPRHIVYFRIIGVLSVAIIVALIGWLVSKVLGG